MGKVLFFTGQTQGRVLTSMGASYGAQLRELGYDFVHVELQDHTKVVEVVTEVRRGEPVDFVFSFMNFGVNLIDKPGGSRNLWDIMDIPFLSLIGDTPAYYFDLNVCLAPNHARLYGFPEHEALRRRLPSFTPGYIGGYQAVAIDKLELDELDFKAKASGQLLFLKNGNDPKKLWDTWDVLNARPLKALRELASYLAADLTNPKGNQIDDLVTEYFANLGFDLNSMLKLRLFFNAQLDDYLRRVKSAMMAEALMDFPVQIIGVNWEHLDFSGKRATFVHEWDYPRSIGLIRDGLGVIDMSPNTGLSPHDRPCRAFGAYTLCVTNEQSFFRDTLPHADDVCFRFDRESFQNKIADVLAHPARYVDIGIEVAAAFRRNNSEESAVRRLADTAAMIKLSQRRERLPDSPDYFVWPPKSLS